MKLDDSKIPNAEGVSAQSSVATDYVQPYRGTTVVLAYDSEKVANPPKTMDELVEWMKENPGTVCLQCAGNRRSQAIPLPVLPFTTSCRREAITSDDPKWEDQWDEGF